MKNPEDNEFRKLKQIIINSSSAKTYFKLKQALNGKPVHRSASEDDWHFCYLILKFIPLSNKNAKELLEKFLTSERYRKKLESRTYIQATVDKVISYNLEQGDRGTMNHLVDICPTNTDRERVDISKIIRVCNLLEIFHLKSKHIKMPETTNISRGDNNSLKVEFFGGRLTGQDLLIYIYILFKLAERKKYLDGSNIVSISISSLLKQCNLNRSIEVYKKIFRSLEKLSKTYLTYNKQVNSDYRYSDRGTLLKYRYVERTSKYKAHITVEVNTCFGRLLGNYSGILNYSIVNWDDFTAMPNESMKVIYYLMCLYIKPSDHFTSIKIDTIREKLYPGISKKSSKDINNRIRKLLKRFKRITKDSTDFTIDLVYDSPTLNSIRVKRSKKFVEDFRSL